MFVAMILLIVLGVLLLLTAPFLGRLLAGSGGDPVGITRIVLVVAAVLLLVALFIRPHSDETAAFPPPPDLIEENAR